MSHMCIGHSDDLKHWRIGPKYILVKLSTSIVYERGDPYENDYAGGGGIISSPQVYRVEDMKHKHTHTLSFNQVSRGKALQHSRRRGHVIDFL